MGFNIGHALAFGGSIGALGGLLGGGGNNPAKSKLAKFMAAQQAMRYAQAEKQMKEQVGDITRGYDAAIGNQSLGVGAAKNDVKDLQKQAMAGAQQQTINSGLGNTSVLGNLNRGIYSDAAKQMSHINAQLANNLASLQVQRAQGIAGAKSNLANFFQNRSGAETALNSQFWNAMPATQPINPVWGALGQLGGAFLGNYAGGLGYGMGAGGGGGMGGPVLH